MKRRKFISLIKIAPLVLVALPLVKNTEDPDLKTPSKTQPFTLNQGDSMQGHWHAMNTEGSISGFPRTSGALGFSHLT